MALWISRDGVIKCAASHDPNKGDAYIDDRVHYRLALAGRIKTANGKIWEAVEPLIEEKTNG